MSRKNTYFSDFPFRKKVGTSLKVGKDYSVYNCKGRGKEGEIIAFGNISYGCDDALLPLVFFFLLSTYKQSEKGVSSPSPLSLTFTWVRRVEEPFLKRIHRKGYLSPLFYAQTPTE